MPVLTPEAAPAPCRGQESRARVVVKGDCVLLSSPAEYCEPHPLHKITARGGRHVCQAGRGHRGVEHGHPAWWTWAAVACSACSDAGDRQYKGQHGHHAGLMGVPAFTGVGRVVHGTMQSGAGLWWT
ncbi:hypothetical protein GOB86_09630 [Acetobacter lambici]|uniref:Uncharacterized protein n=1 Tax=Acetobacter lambici TaxID=1332824 RepID=A0ABT1F1H9_9PROT|nr:hypothetical protein [Acetobacter lambici]MCP1242833.1 hypothetical protein [Acetobacter lambici]MCP1259008.1 hypothetical protein [Acetobacter lambici]NHO57316.1 hypothetical protein [Acetobacter lambici]